MSPFCRTLRSRLRSRRWRTKSPAPRADAEALERARRIAEAQVDLNRVRAQHRNLIARTLADPDYQPVWVLRQKRRPRKLNDRFERIRTVLPDIVTVLPISPKSVKWRTLRLSKATKRSRRFLRTELASWRRSIDMSVVLYRDASPRSAILTRCVPGASFLLTVTEPILRNLPTAAATVEVA
jgi:hypothetical protein